MAKAHQTDAKADESAKADAFVNPDGIDGDDAPVQDPAANPADDLLKAQAIEAAQGKE